MFMVYVCSLSMILVYEVGVWGVVFVIIIFFFVLFGIEVVVE